MNQDRKFGDPLPQEFLDAQKHYEEVLSKDPQWIQKHHGKYVAFFGKQPVAVSQEVEDYEDFSARVRELYGHGLIFMLQVDKNYPSAPRLRPRTTGMLRPNKM